MDCKDCGSISYYAHEADMAAMERTIHRQWITIIVLIVAIVMSFVGFFLYENQFEHSTTTTTTEDISQYVDADGTAIVAGIRDAIYGNEGQTNG